MYRLALWMIELWLSTLSERTLYSHEAEKILSLGRPCIVALWHRDLIYGLFHFRKRPAVIMVSGSKDGEWVARAVSLWGQHPVRGSRFKGGKGAIKEMATRMNELGIGAGIVADGSQGPPEKVQIGALVLARLTNAPILPLGVAVDRAKRLNTWDRLVIPYPFTRVTVALGPPLLVPKDCRGRALEPMRDALQRGLDEAYEIAKRGLHCEGR